MNARILRTVLAHAAAAAGGPDAPDGELLARVANARDQTAFAELVRRHGRLVWAVCRHRSPTESDADDAFQATFLALWQGAHTVRATGTAAPWLHAVAHRVAGRANRAAARRIAREKQAAACEADSRPPPSAWDATMAAVHEEVAALPESQRVPFVLCVLGGVGVTEAAEQLGWKLGTLSGRLTRAKQTLLDRLAKRGIPAAAAGAVLVGPVGVVPAAVLAKGVLLSTAAVPSTISSLAQGVTGMAMTRIKLLAAGLLLAGGLTAGLGAGGLTAADPLKPMPSADPPELKQKAQAYDVVYRVATEVAAQGQPPAKWEYDFLTFPQSKPGVPTFPDADGYRKLFREKEAQGWEFAGGLTALVNTGTKDGGVKAANEPVMVFRRPFDPERTKAEALHREQGQRQLLSQAKQSLYRQYLAQRPQPMPDPAAAVAKLKPGLVAKLRENPGARFPSTLDAAVGDDAGLRAAVDAYGRTVLEAEVMTALAAALRQEVEAARKQTVDGLRSVANTLSPGVVMTVRGNPALDLDGLAKLLVAAAKQRFPDAPADLRVAVLRKDELILHGSKEQVEWAVGVVKQLTGEK